MSLAARAVKEPALAGKLIARAFLPLDRQDDDESQAACILVGSALAALVKLGQER